MQSVRGVRLSTMTRSKKYYLLLVSLCQHKYAVSVDNNESCPSSLLHYEEFYINGTWVKPLSPRTTTIPVINPSTADPLVSLSLAGSHDVDTAVSAAREAFPSWSQETTVQERIDHIENLLELYMDRQEEMAQLISLEMGAPIDLARDSQVDAGAYHIQDFLRILQNDEFEFERTLVGDDPEDPTTRILMDPVGVVAMIVPWNWPMNQVTLKVIPALAVGCTCVLKPSEVAPLSSLLFAEMMHEAGFPPGVFNLINGDGEGAGTHLTRHPDVDMVSFTGSTRAGALISKAAADTFKRVSLELGGKGANIIFADAPNVNETVQDGVYDCFGNSGQSCNAPTRMLVERSIYNDAIEIARQVAEEIEVKSAEEPGDFMGPVVSLQQFDKIQKYIEIGITEGARLVAGGLGRPDGTNGRGFFVKPTVFCDIDNTMVVFQEEIFGPVLCIMPFDSEEEALAIANDTPYGLTNYVHSMDGNRRNRLARRLRSGMVEMNYMGGADGSPFGGMKASGNGREGGVWGLEEFCEVKAVTGWFVEEEESK